ncbi:MAG: biopolymer transporter Tol [Bacteroidota bacterium]|nr:biopolymer transporter Tol [Bacteroidota bacterium]
MPSRLISAMSNNFYRYSCTINKAGTILLPALILCAVSHLAFAQTTSTKVEVPDWALPGSATHKQVPPPPNFHRPTRTENKRIGIFEGQSDVGAALVPGSSSYNPATKQYTITSAGYNVWYTRDEFRFLWKKMSGDVSLAADINFPDKEGYFDRKAILIIRQNLEDDSKEAMVALHGAGLIHLAYRPEKGQSMKEMRVDQKGALRLGIEKRGNAFAIFTSMNGEPMKQFGEPIQLSLDGPFYVGIGFCSHLPDKVDTAILSNVVLENAAGRVR